jgi:hypothetical protein
MTALLPTLPTTIYHQPENLADDMLTGAEQIASFTGDTVRRTNYLLEQKRLPAFQEGRVWKMRKSTYLAHVQRLESAALERCAAAK